MSSSRLEKEIQRLECSINYNSDPSTIKKIREGGGDLAIGVSVGH